MHTKEFLKLQSFTLHSWNLERMLSVMSNTLSLSCGSLTKMANRIDNVIATTPTTPMIQRLMIRWTSRLQELDETSRNVMYMVVVGAAWASVNPFGSEIETDDSALDMLSSGKTRLHRLARCTLPGFMAGARRLSYMLAARIR